MNTRLQLAFTLLIITLVGCRKDINDERVGTYLIYQKTTEPFALYYYDTFYVEVSKAHAYGSDLLISNYMNLGGYTDYRGVVTCEMQDDGNKFNILKNHWSDEYPTRYTGGAAGYFKGDSIFFAVISMSARSEPEHGNAHGVKID